MLNLLWLALIAIPILALVGLWERKFSKGKWLTDEPDED